jgi:hypothetical protein
MTSLDSYQAAQVSRLMAVPDREMVLRPRNNPLLEGVRQRNAMLDYLFYDLGVLSKEEAARLGPDYAAEGAILAVGPSVSPSLDIWQDFPSFAHEGPNPIRAIAIAGVGSSALGAAAFARNVADAIGEPVLSVVSGYGMSDVMAEAIGGFFWFGALNSVRHVFKSFEFQEDKTHQSSTSSVTDLIQKSPDVAALYALLEGGQKVNFLVGHSKGNLVISEALFELKKRRRDRLDELAKGTRIVTLSARIAMPSAFPDIVDVMGSLDLFGEMNSRKSIPVDVSVPGAWHHTNTELPMHLPVTKTLQPLVEDLGKAVSQA